MVRRSPCELYLKYLIVHPDQYVTSTIKDIVIGQALDYPGDAYIWSLRERVVPPTPFYPSNRNHPRSYRFICAHKLLGFFHPDDEALEAHRMLELPRVKELIETMALSGDSPAYISHRVQKLGVTCSVQGVEKYLRYYWDLELVDSVEAEALLKIRLDRILDTGAGTEPTLDQRMQHRALSKAKYRDPRRLAVEMPCSPMASLMNQMRLGIMPTQVELSRLLSATRMAAVCRANEALFNGSPTDAARARDFTLTAKLMTELIADIGSPDTELQRDLQQLVLETEQGQVPHIKELAARQEPLVVEAEEVEYVDSE